MGVITFLIIIVAIVVAIVVGGMVASALPSLGSRNKGELRTVKYQLRAAETALRRIANGSGNPVLEAQIALDDIEKKELEA